MSDINPGAAQFHQARLNKLVGARITSVGIAPDEFGLFDPWPILVLRKDGKQIVVQVSQDPEGNGPGFLFIDGVDEPTEAERAATVPTIVKWED